MCHLVILLEVVLMSIFHTLHGAVYNLLSINLPYGSVAFIVMSLSVSHTSKKLSLCVCTPVMYPLNNHNIILYFSIML